MRQSINRQTVPLFAATAVVVVAIALLSFLATRSYQNASADVDHSHKAISDINAVLEDAQNAETGQRGFVLTGDESYLEPYETGLARLPDDLQRLRAHVDGDAEQVARFEALEVHLDRRMSYLAGGVAARRIRGFDVAQAGTLTGNGKAEMDQVRAIVGEMRDHEQALFDQRSADRDGTARNQMIALAVLVVVELLLLVGCFAAIRRWLRERQARETQAAALADARYRAVGDVIPFGVWATDGGGELTYVSPSFLSFIGMSFDEYRKHGWRRIFGSDDASRDDSAHLADGWRTAMELRQPFEYIRPVHGADGTTRTVLGKSIPILDLDGGLVGYAGINLDVTEQQRAEHALRMSEERYRLLVDATPAMIATTNADGTVQYHNARWAEYTGRAPADLAGDGWKSVVHPDDVDGIVAQYDQVFREPRQFEFDYRVRSRDGRYRWFRDLTTPIFDDDGTVSMWISVDIDIDARKRSEEAMRAESEAKDDFLGMVSHEVRTPLTVILGNARALRRMTDMPPDQRVASTNDILVEAERLQRLIENMLTLSRAERRGDVEVEPVLLQRELRRLAAVHGQDRPITVVAEEGLLPVGADPVYLEQIVQNLISNAVKYSPAGSPIELCAVRQGDCAAISVLDRGYGIAESDIERVFQPFFRAADSARKATGIGLGLTVCDRLVRAQGGEMWARQREGGGTEVGFILPLFGLEDEAECGVPTELAAV